jgi:aminoglycoside 6'-N-acetyltransferase
VIETSVLRGTQVVLRPATSGDIARLVEIRGTPEVFDRWGGDDLEADVRDALSTPELHVLVIEDSSGVIGAIQWEVEDDPKYSHASMDIYLHPSVHGRGIGSDAVRTLARYLIHEQGHHRLVIDPAADNATAIACYAKVGFRVVGVMRRYELGSDGTWHDGTLMELLAEDLID